MLGTARKVLINSVEMSIEEKPTGSHGQYNKAACERGRFVSN